MTSIYVRAELPPTCYVHEVALWLAFGRVPPVLYREDYSIWLEAQDARSDWAMLSRDGSLAFDDFGYTAAELIAHGAEVDFARYSKIMSRSTARTGAEVLEGTEKALHMFRPLRGSDGSLLVDEEWIRETREKARREAADLDWAVEVGSRLSSVVDVARSEVFQALASGQLCGKGWLGARPAAEDDDNDAVLEGGALADVPSASWTLRGFDWEDNALSTPAGKYLAVQVTTADVLKLFPRPHCAPRVIPADSYPDAIVVDEEGGAAGGNEIGHSRPRGRPATGAGVVRHVVQNVFAERIRRGAAPPKAEAMVQEVMDFVSLAFDQRISRTTAQSYLAPLRARLPKIMPEKPAGN
jgi:hypothetical protein